MIILFYFFQTCAKRSGPETKITQDQLSEIFLAWFVKIEDNLLHGFVSLVILLHYSVIISLNPAEDINILIHGLIIIIKLGFKIHICIVECHFYSENLFSVNNIELYELFSLSGTASTGLLLTTSLFKQHPGSYFKIRKTKK